MKLLVIGGAGKTGYAIVQQALSRGDTVTALIHNYAPMPEAVTTIEGDATDPAILDRCIAGQEVVIDAIGNEVPYKASSLETNAAEAILASMQRHNVRRFVVISALGVGESKRNTSFIYDHLLMPTFLRGALQDKAGMEAEVSQSPLDWTIVRPAILTDDDPTGVVKTYDPADGDVAHKIAREDLAAWILNLIASGLHIREAVNVATV